MTDLPYSFKPSPGCAEYKVTSQLKNYLEILLEHAENKDTIEQILELINGYTEQLKRLRKINRLESTREVYKAIDGFFSNAKDENKKEIQCKTGCTACCFIDVDISGDEAILIIAYCKENSIEIDEEYLAQQAVVGRKTYTSLSRCFFLKENLCSIYPVRPMACRKHWVRTDPSLCDFSKNISNQVGGYFNINTEILASALLNVDEVGSFEKVLLNELKKNKQL